jgi:hypothetical protein
MALVVLLTACRAQPSSSPVPLPVPSPVATGLTPSAPAQVPMAPQNPSPMQEHTRRHERLDQPRRPDPGVHLSIDGILPKSIDVFIPQRALGVDSAPLLIHFMGAAWVPQRAVALMPRPVIVAAAFFGSGSGTYKRPFAADTLLYGRLVDSLRAQIARVTGAPRISGIYLSGWSAGYGAIREIVRRPENLPLVDGVLLLDGIHAGYIPDGKPLAEGGVIDTTDVMPFVEFARLAAAGSKRLIITHTEIFPGTFASTTETTDWLLGALHLKRVPVLEWGPMGSQLLSRAQLGRLEVLGFAGNAGPDHVDLFHGMGTFVERLLAP